MPYEALLLAIIALPIAGFLTTALVGRRLGLNAFWIPVGAVVLSWLAALAVIIPVLTGSIGEQGISVTLWRWIPDGNLQVDIGFFVDQLTAVLLLVVTTIGMLVHVYSIGYMRHDPGYWRFFA